MHQRSGEDTTKDSDRHWHFARIAPITRIHRTIHPFGKFSVIRGNRRQAPKQLRVGTSSDITSSDRCYTQTTSDSRQKEQVCFGHF